MPEPTQHELYNKVEQRIKARSYDGLDSQLKLFKYENSPEAKEIHAAYKAALDSFWKSHQELKDAGRIPWRSDAGIKTLDILSQIVGLRVFSAFRDHLQLRQVHQKNFFDPTGSMIWLITGLADPDHTMSHDGKALQIPFHRMMGTLIKKLGITAEQIHKVQTAHDGYSPRYDEGIREAEEALGSLTQSDPAMSGAIRSSIHAFIWETERLRKFNKFVDRSYVGSNNVHLVADASSSFEGAAYAYLMKDMETFHRKIYRAFSPETEKRVNERYGIFIRPLRHALTMFCGYVNQDIEAIVAAGSKRYKPKPLSYVERLRQTRLETYTKEL